MKSFLFLVLIFLISQPIDVWGLKCYTCDPSNADCKDPFDSTKSSIQKSITTGTACTKSVVEGKNGKSVTRSFVNSSGIDHACPKMNACITGELDGIKDSVCCCDGNLCNTATIKKITFGIIALSLLLNYY